MIRIMYTDQKVAEQAAKSFGCAEYTIGPCTHYGVADEGYVILSFANGRTLFEREANFYDDSDFYVTYMEDSGKIREIQYATTRGWSYANGVTIDATDDVKEVYNQHLAQKMQEAERIRESRLDKIAEDCKITREQLSKLFIAYKTDDMRTRMIKLLSSNLRSAFRKRIAQQTRDWLADESPKYPTPLSWKQAQYV